MQMVVDKTRQARWLTYEMEKGQDIVKNFKRHSDGTFTSDFTHYLDKIKAKDFVEWLASTKRVGCDEDLLQMGEV
ncbi:glucagon-2-like [Centroberyx gerrardi]